MKYSKRAWDQLKSITCDRLVSALEQDGWIFDTGKGSQRIYRKIIDDIVHRVSIHYHAQKTYGANLLKSLLEDIGWSEDDMRRLKLIK
jgi:predicted RNA binding protein YcfA (HicA-like mRNA interferase family)